jgi:hypothetical protein
LTASRRDILLQHECDTWGIALMSQQTGEPHRLLLQAKRVDSHASTAMLLQHCLLAIRLSL